MVTVKMTKTKYDIENFCGKENCSHWKRKMKDLLIQQEFIRLAWEGKEAQKF